MTVPTPATVPTSRVTASVKLLRIGQPAVVSETVTCDVARCRRSSIERTIPSSTIERRSSGSMTRSRAVRISSWVGMPSSLGNAPWRRVQLIRRVIRPRGVGGEDLAALEVDVPLRAPPNCGRRGSRRGWPACSSRPAAERVRRWGAPASMPCSDIVGAPAKPPVARAELRSRAAGHDLHLPQAAVLREQRRVDALRRDAQVRQPPVAAGAQPRHRPAEGGGPQQRAAADRPRARQRRLRRGRSGLRSSVPGTAGAWTSGVSKLADEAVGAIDALVDERADLIPPR